MKYPKSPQDKTGGIVYFGRMLDKIRLMAAGELHPDLHANLGKAFDQRCVDFLGVEYDALQGKVLEGLDDGQALEWCFENGHRPTGEQIEVWNGFMSKRGWNDEASEILARRKKESGFESRNDIQTMFQYIDADEGRL
ncbi:MAG: DUF5069 domain-containing protein [Terrimicrobiaceae bacterium]|jgi:gluconokinase|nr:DUF5069 domain-containing protein [Terrimicrobiaceae bacterium]